MTNKDCRGFYELYNLFLAISSAFSGAPTESAPLVCILPSLTGVKK